MTTARRRAARAERIRQLAQPSLHIAVAHAVPDDPPVLARLEDSTASEEREVSGDDREIDQAALRDFAHRAAAPALCDARDQSGPRRIGEGVEQGGIEEAIKGAGPGRRLTGRRRRAIFAYLRHNASIPAAVPASRRTVGLTPAPGSRS